MPAADPPPGAIHTSMTRDDLRAALTSSLYDTHLRPEGPTYRGKVRDTYADGDRLVLVTTDRISAFDHVFPEPVPFKGQVLNRLAAYSFERAADVGPNHVLAVPHGNVTVARRCAPIPIEFVVRGYLAGHAARVYAAGGRTLCGAALPDGLREGERLPAPILTPATKADEGHDEDVTPSEIVARGMLDAETLAACTDFALRLYARGTAVAAEAGLLLVDTKYEFGRAPDGTVVLIDEIHTPDSSRYYHADGYDERLAAGAPQRQLSKEFLREWLIAQGFQGLDGQPRPVLSEEIRLDVAARYVELFERLTRTAFVPDLRPLQPEALFGLQ